MLFEGLRDTATLTIAPGIVLKYTAVHGPVFLVFGVAAAGLFALAEFNTLHPWAILGGNLVAAVVMLGILFAIIISPSMRR